MTSKTEPDILKGLPPESSAMKGKLIVEAEVTLSNGDKQFNDIDIMPLVLGVPGDRVEVPTRDIPGIRFISLIRKF